MRRMWTIPSWLHHRTEAKKHRPGNSARNSMINKCRQFKQKCIVNASDDEIAAASLSDDNHLIPQPQTRLPAPAVKPYVPKPTPEGSILQPQPKPEDFIFPPPPTLPPAPQEVPKPATRTSIAKRLSIQELLSAEMPQPTPPQKPEEK